MKKIILIGSMILTSGIINAQLRPVNNSIDTSYHLPGYYQNVSSHNNSMENNKPADPNRGLFQGNGNYIDPSRSPVNFYNINNTNALPGPFNMNTSVVNAGTFSR